MKTKTWILLLSALAALCLTLSALFLAPGEAASSAQILSGGQVLRTVSLDQEQEFTVETEQGWNVVTVRGGKIAVTQASCPDHYCMQRGFCNGGAQIVCLPNRLVIRFLGEQEIDAEIG